MDKEELEKLVEFYKLSKEEHDNILFGLIENSLKGKTPSKNPVLKYVLAQPGAGKSTLIKQLFCDGNFVNINSDNYRFLRKDYYEILEKYPAKFVRLTNYDAHKIGDELLQEAINKKLNILREKAPLSGFLSSLPQGLPSDYSLVFDVLAVGNLNSLLSTRERYEEAIISGNKTVKLSDVEKHNESYKLLQKLVLENLANAKINIYIRSKSNNKKPLKIYPSKKLKNASEALIFYQESDNLQTSLNFEKRYNAIISQMKKRNAPEEQFEQMQTIFNMYTSYKS